MFIQDSMYQKITKTGSFLTDLFKRNKGVITFLKHGVPNQNLGTL